MQIITPSLNHGSYVMSPIVDELSLCSQLRTNTYIGILLSSYDVKEEQITNTGWDENTSRGFAENS